MSWTADMRKAMQPLKFTPLHPQWLSYRDRILKSWLRAIPASSRVLDIGCFNRWPASYLAANCEYIGLDYLPAGERGYVSNVDLWGDAQSLPLADQSVDVVLLFDVFEHIPCGELALAEIARILKPDGTLYMQVPFMYPLHDTPMDYRRLTQEGLVQAGGRAGLQVKASGFKGTPVETAALLANIALAKLCVSLLERKSVAAICLLLVVPLMIVINLFGFAASKMERRDAMMPFSYQLQFTRPAQQETR